MPESPGPGESSSDGPRVAGDAAAGDAVLPPFQPSLAALAQRYALDNEAVPRLGRFASLLVHDELAPTTVREPARVRDDHLADALVGLELPELARASTIADLGAGAGVPGIPLAIALPGALVTLVEGNNRKCEFMANAIQTLGLRNATVIHARAETWIAGLGSCDAVTARALAPLDVLAEYAAPLLRLGGVLVAWRGRRDHDAESDAARAAAILGLEIDPPILTHPYDGAEHRHLHVLRKVKQTPSRFPRRDGVARKRPLGHG